MSKIENLGTLLELPCTLSSKNFLHKPTYVSKCEFFEKRRLWPRIFKKFKFCYINSYYIAKFRSRVSYLLSEMKKDDFHLI